MRYLLDPGVRRLDGGRVLVGGSPRRVFRLTPAGARLLDAIERGDDLLGPDLAMGDPSPGESPQIRPPGESPQIRPAMDPRARPGGGGRGVSPAVGRLVRRLVDAGALHPLPVGGRWSPDDVTIVIPVLDADVATLVPSCGPAARIVVVDDGSDPPLPPIPGADLLHRPANSGPAAARNTGWRAASTPLVAFLDADTRPGPGWLAGLLPHLDDPTVGFVAPRVVGPWPPPGASLGRRYEAARSPLDLGPRPGRVRPGTPVPYVPGAALVVRTGALHDVAGFDEELRAGEDVDLAWRLDAAGWLGRYAPDVVVRHEPRSTWPGWLRQRITYGRSAAPLARRHPGRLPPARVSGWSVATWVLTFAGWPFTAAAGAVVAAATTALARRLPRVDRPWATAALLVGEGTVATGRQLAAAITRVWWPVALPAALLSRRARHAVLAAALLPALATWWRERPPLDPVRYVVLRLLDDAAYGIGVWQGVLATGELAPLLPVLRDRPRDAPPAHPAHPAPAATPAPTLASGS